jgi:integrase
MAKQHTTPYRLYKRGKIFYAYISFVTKNGQRYLTRLSTGEILAEKAEQFCLKYIAAVNERAAQGLSDKDLSTEKAFFLWFENKAKYYTTCKDILRKLLILLPYFEKTFSQINDEDITRFMNDSRQKGRSNATINRYLSTLCAVRTYCANAGFSYPPLNLNKYKLKEPAENIKYLKDWDTAQKIINNAAPHLKPIIRTALYTGLRLGNILNLKWENIDFNARQITLKVKDSTRQGGKNLSIPMVQPLYQMLKELPKTNDYVFLYKDKPIKSIKKSWHSVFYKPNGTLKDASLPYVNFHTLRHTAGTWLLKSCKNLKIVQQILGHSNIQTTLKYAHVLDEEKRNALDALYQ